MDIIFDSILSCFWYFWVWQKNRIVVVVFYNWCISDFPENSSLLPQIWVKKKQEFSFKFLTPVQNGEICGTHSAK